MSIVGLSAVAEEIIHDTIFSIQASGVADDFLYGTVSASGVLAAQGIEVTEDSLLDLKNVIVSGTSYNLIDSIGLNGSDDWAMHLRIVPGSGIYVG